MAVNYMNNFRFDMRPYSLVYMYKCSRENCCPHLQGIKRYRLNGIIFLETGILQKCLVLVKHILKNSLSESVSPLPLQQHPVLLQACAHIYQ